MSIAEWCHWLQNTSWAVEIRQSDFLFPLIEGTHIMALSLSVGLVLLLDLRLLRIAFQSEPVSKIMHAVMPWALPGFAVMFVTGILLFFAQAEKVYVNTYFRFKFFFLLLLGLNAAFYQWKYYPKMADWDMAPSVPAGARAVAVLSLVLWVAVIALGRTMAYEL
jgi:hypothetical protein